MKILGDRAGSTLVEALAAAAVLLLASLMMARGFMMSAELMSRGKKINRDSQAVAAMVESGCKPDRSEESSIVMILDGDILADIPVTVDEYGTDTAAPLLIVRANEKKPMHERDGDGEPERTGDWERDEGIGGKWHFIGFR